MAGHASNWFKAGGAGASAKGRIFVPNSKLAAYSLSKADARAGLAQGDRFIQDVLRDLAQTPRGAVRPGLSPERVLSAAREYAEAQGLDVRLREPERRPDGRYMVTISGGGSLDVLDIRADGPEDLRTAMASAFREWDQRTREAQQRVRELEREAKVKARADRRRAQTRRRIYRDYPQLKPLADKLVVDDYPDDSKISREVAMLARLDKPVLTALVAGGASIHMGRAKLPQLNNLRHLENSSPSSGDAGGWPPGSTWDEPGGVYSGAEKVAAVATDGTQDGSASVAVHEVGHAIGDVLGWNFDSDLLKFHRELHPRLNPYLAQGGPGGWTGVRELLAEGLAMTVANETGARLRLGDAFVDYLKRGPLTGRVPDAAPDIVAYIRSVFTPEQRESVRSRAQLPVADLVGAVRDANRRALVEFSRYERGGSAPKVDDYMRELAVWQAALETAQAQSGGASARRRRAA